MAEMNGRPRTKSMLSFGSHKSGGSGPKMDLTETPRDKIHRRVTSKADPNKAMDEAQPVMQALEKSTMESLRSMQHRDIHGNIITDPDRSNPTRPRLERPLDTIRSFEAAIDGSYNRRSSRIMDTAQSRRSSYYQGYNNGYNYNNQQREGWGSHGNRMGPSRPESYADGYGSGYNRQSPAPFTSPPQRRFGPRNYSDPALYGNNSNSNGVYANQSYQSTYDTVATTGSGSGNSGAEPWSNSTDPSSENSSVDRVNQTVKPDLAETYGFSGFGGAPQFQGPMFEEPGRAGPAYGQQGYGMNGSQQGYGQQGNDLPPPPPPHMSKKPIGSHPLPKLPTSQQASRYDGYNSAGDQRRVDAGGKRKSWLRRRFSKNE